MTETVQHPDFEAALRGAAAEAAKNQAVSDIGSRTLAGLGTGLLAGGGYALWRMLHRPDAVSSKRTRPAEETLPVKVASQPDVGYSGVLRGDNALDSSGVWWKGPLALAGGLTAAMGTAGIVRSLSDRLAASRRKAKEEDAKAQFEAALSKSLAPATKMAGDEDLGDKLVTLFNMLTKEAALPDLADLLNGYGIYAVGTGLGAGALAYQASRNKNRKALQKAVMMRQAARARTTPTELILPGSASQPPVLAGTAAE